jgi:hypothetical protein
MLAIYTKKGEPVERESDIMNTNIVLTIGKDRSLTQEKRESERVIS